MQNFKHTQTEARVLWVEALRSGNYDQIQGALHRAEPKTFHPAGYCCLGVACDLYQQHEGGLKVNTDTADGESEFDGNASFLPKAVQDWLGLSDHSGAYSYYVDDDDEWDHIGEDSLADKNDGDASFTDIADIIECAPPGLFDSEEI